MTTELKNIERAKISAGENKDKTIQIFSEFKDIYWAMNEQLQSDNFTSHKNQNNVMDMQALVLDAMRKAQELDVALTKIMKK